MRKLIKGKNDFASVKPELLLEWDYEKNMEISPSAVLPGSHKKVWWKCSVCGNSWQAQINTRSRGGGCRICGRVHAAKKTTETRLKGGTNSFASKFPELLSEWDYEKNTFSPEKITAHCGKIIWWKCPICGESYESKISKRAAGQSCPYCAGIKVKAGVNDLQTRFPTIAEEWDYGKNGLLTPNQVTPHSSKKVYWKCSICGYEWPAFISQRAEGTGCPKCAKRFHSSLPEQIVFWYVKQQFPDAINSYKPQWLTKFEEIDIFIPNINTAIEYDGVQWHTKPYADKKKGLKIFNHCYFIRIREPGLMDVEDGSIVIQIQKLQKDNSHLYGVINALAELINCQFKTNWAPDYNLDRDLNQIYAEYSRARRDNSLQAKNPELAKEWDRVANYPLTPDQVSIGCDYKAHWICSKCKNKWIASVGDRARGHGCSVCAGKAVLKGYNDLATKHPELLDEWDYEKNKDLIPENVTFTYTKKVWWKCNKCKQSYSQSVNDRIKGHGCPICAGKLIVPGINDLKSKNPELALEWNYEKNGGLKPENIASSSNKKVWWKCAKCGREWQAVVYSRIRKNKIGCPDCKRKNRRPDHTDYVGYKNLER